ncbi:serine hydrolase [Ktedonobacter sp. SOSP1-85]|uniref:serine hydrolase domain-containing protein n=1 Tax=Ktedonobacter sp. SOSP1-85 TaxID=2778367 RepID=UPI001915B947|nr:serine hydrolase domain-containing protein [Ktedonobacter sp. SOSP1-85]GHO79183.1 serine hydrolase [Ktedonobacter sp. SOSP1-85]
MNAKPSFFHTPITRRRVVQTAGVASLLAAGGLLAFQGYRSAFAAHAADSSIPATLAPGGELDQYVKQLAEQDQFSGTFLVAQGDKPVLLQAYGMANKERHIPNGPQTLYATASMAKSFTATAITQLAQQQKLTFTDPIGKYLQGFPADIADSVTIHQLLTHTSGMGDFHLVPDYKAKFLIWQSAAETLNGLLEIIKQQPLQFTPGTAFSYSNSGYVTLGTIVAQVSGMDYYDYIHQHIFAAAGMSKSRFYTKPQRERMQDIAHPYNSERVDISEQQGFIGEPAGDAYTTVEDMLRYSQALQTHQLLNPSFTDLLMTGKVAVPPPPAPNGPAPTAASGQQPQGTPPPLPQRSVMQAYGLLDTLVINGNKRIVWHSGGSEGASTVFEMFLTQGYNLVILSNYGAQDSFMNLVMKAEGLILQG